MNKNSQRTLRRVTQNDPSLTNLSLVNNIYGYAFGEFYSDNSDDYSTLGAAIANNTQLDRLTVWLSDDLPLGVTNRVFFNGLKSNSSISDLRLYCNMNTPHNIAGGVGQEILQVYQENNNLLTDLRITHANLQSGGDRVIWDTLRSCRNLQLVILNFCNITDAQLLTIADAIRGHNMLETLHLLGNNIGNAGCGTIAALLEDPSCNMHTLDLGDNIIHNEGATTIANSLININKLQKLFLHQNQIDYQSVEDVFSNILCNETSINETSASNHTLHTLVFWHRHGQQLESLLELNTHTNKNHVAIKKILKYHPNIDMEPFFEWDVEGEQTLKALPYIINWFERARVAVADEDEDQYNVDGRKLNTIFQFAKAMPLLFGGIATIKGDRKRKRSEK